MGKNQGDCWRGIGARVARRHFKNCRSGRVRRHIVCILREVLCWTAIRARNGRRQHTLQATVGIICVDCGVAVRIGLRVQRVIAEIRVVRLEV